MAEQDEQQHDAVTEGDPEWRERTQETNPHADEIEPPPPRETGGHGPYES